MQSTIERLLALSLDTPQMCQVLAAHSHPDIISLVTTVTNDDLLAGALRQWLQGRAGGTPSSLPAPDVVAATTPIRPIPIMNLSGASSLPRRVLPTTPAEPDTTLRQKHKLSLQQRKDLERRAGGPDRQGYFQIQNSQCRTFSTARRFASPVGWESQYIFDNGPEKGYRKRTECRAVSAQWSASDSPGPGAYTPRYAARSGTPTKVRGAL